MDFVHDTYFLNPMTVHNAFGAYGDSVGENNLDLQSFIERTKSYVEEYKYNLNLALSRFKLKNAKENEISDRFVLTVLIELGAIAAIQSKATGNIILQPFEVTRWNYYAEPTEIKIIPYYQNGVTMDDIGTDRIFNKDNFEIVYLNLSKIGFKDTFMYEARIYSMLNQLLINNVFAKSLQCVLQGKQEDKFDFKRIIHSILNQNGFLSIDTENNPNINELLTAPDLNIEWLADKVYEAKQNARRDLHERLGITHTPYEKKERLTNVEIQTQNEATDLLNISTLNSLNEGFERVNKHFNLLNPLLVELTDIGINNSKNEEIEEQKEVNINE